MVPFFQTVLSLGGCAAGGDTGDFGPGCSDCTLEDANNYSLSSTLDVDVFTLKAQTDAVIDWSGLTTDVQGQPVSPGDVDQVLLVAFLELEPEEIAAGLASDSLDQGDATLFVICSPEGVTRCALSDFSILGSSLDVEEVFLPDAATWLVALQTTGGVGARSFVFLKATEQATETTVSVGNDTAALSVDVDLRGLVPLAVLPGAVPRLEWGELETDGLGNPMDLSSLDSLVVLRSAWDVDQAAASILDLEREAADSWSLALDGGVDADLAALEGDTAFTGFSDEGTWWLGFKCSGCTHPAPRFLTRVVLGEGP